MRRKSPCAFAWGIALCALWPAAGRAEFVVENLTSDGFVPADNLDPSLKNPWGMSFGPGGPFWISNQAANNSTLEANSGTPQGLFGGQGVAMPTTAAGPQGPTGQVFNPFAGKGEFALPTGGPALFLLADLNGTIDGWNAGTGTGPGTVAQVAVPATPGTVFTGLAVGTNAAVDSLYAADFGHNAIKVFGPSFAPVTLAGDFADPFAATKPTFHAYNVQVVGSTVYVTYADSTSRTAGGGGLAAFDLDGHLLRAFGSNAAGGGPLDRPWGVALAPASFGQFGGDLLVGNEGDGHISAYDPATGGFLGQLDLRDAGGAPVADTGLWTLAFGGSGKDGDPSTLFFVAGINGERDGVFGSIRSVPEPSSIALLGLGGLVLLAGRLRARPSRN